MNRSRSMIRTGIIFLIVCIHFSSSISMEAAKKKKTAEDALQNVLSFIEKSKNKKKTRKVKEQQDYTSIVDINSTLIIEVDKELVKIKAAKLLNIGISEKTLKEISEITEILNMEAEMLESIGRGKGATEAERLKNLDTFAKKIGQLEDFVMSIPSLEERVIKKMEESEGDAYQMIFSEVRGEIDRISTEYDKLIKELNFRLGGWVKRGSGPEAIHIDGFDMIQKGEFYEFPFVVKPTKEEMEKLKALPEAAANVNKKGFSALLDFKEHLSPLSNNLESEIKNALNCTLDSIKSLLEKVKKQVKGSKFELTENTIKKIKNLLDILNRIRKTIQTLDILPAQLESNIQLIELLSSSFKNDILTLPGEFKKIKEEIKRNLQKASSDFKNLVKDEISKIEADCLKNLVDKVKNAVSTVGGIIKFVKNLGVKKSSALVSSNWGADLELSEKVKKFSIDEIPKEASVDLREIGPRNEGDEVYFKAILQRKETKKGEKVKPFILDQKYFMLFRIIYIKISPGLIFADPLKSKEEVAENEQEKTGNIITLDKTFQAVPSYSILFKIGNRKSITYNKYLKFGFGINVAALDFNQDSNYEMGLGLVLSGFNDYLQVGVGWNMEIDSLYWFFGLKLPFGGLSLPSIGEETKSDQ